MALKSSIILLIAANILIPIAILVFASGFFPYKPFLPGLAVEHGKSPEAPFDKVVFMVVDALRRYGKQPISRDKLIVAVTLYSRSHLGFNSHRGKLPVRTRI